VPEGNLTRHWNLPDRLGCFAICGSGRLLLGLAKSLAMADLDAAGGDRLDVTTIVPIEEDEPATRINDGRVDRAGYFVFGTYNEQTAVPLGRFYQFSLRHGLRRLGLGTVAVANSICFSPDGRTMYFCDSPSGQILCCDYDAERAEVGNVRLFATVDRAGAKPDGSVVDSDGGVWNAEWGGGMVQRYDPDGRPSHAIAVPEPHVTCPAFGGAALDELWLTAAQWQVPPATLKALPSSGGVYRAPPTRWRGIPDALFEGTDS
jgi:L-arabinonolactonase